MGKSQASPSPVLTPLAFTPDIKTSFSTRLWDERPSKYKVNVLKNVCLIIFVVTLCEEMANYAINQSLKNFFQKLGWSNKGSNSMKLTYDSVSQFACVMAGFLADEKIGKFKTLMSTSLLDSVGFLILLIAALPGVLSHVGISKALFNIGLFLGVAFSQICMHSLIISYGGDQFSPAAPEKEKTKFFSTQYWMGNAGAGLAYLIFPSISLYGISFFNIPKDYGYVTVYAIGFVMVLIFASLLYFSRARYVNVPPTSKSISTVITVVWRRSKKNFQARMIVLGTLLYLAAFLLNIPASFLGDHGEVGHDMSYVCGVLIVVATVLCIYFGRDSSFLDGSVDTNGGQFDQQTIDDVKKVLRILPLSVFNLFWWVCQNQRGNNQTIIQQTDIRLGSQPDSTQIPGPTVQMFNPFSVLVFVPLVEKVLYPLYEKYAGKPPSRYGKIFAGHCVAALAMFWTSTFEVIRRSRPELTYVDANNVTHFILNNNGHQVMNDIPWWTAIPQYFLVSLAGVLIMIPTYDLCYSEVPQGMRSMSIALCFFVSGMGSTVLSVIVLLFGKFIPANLNNGHMEYMFYTLGALQIVNIFFYVVVMNQMQLGMIPRLGADKEKEEANVQA